MERVESPVAAVPQASREGDAAWEQLCSGAVFQHALASVIPKLHSPERGRRNVAEAAPLDWQLVAKIVGLIAITCACYWPALNGQFLWDDALLVTHNDLLKSPGGLRDIWCSTQSYDFFPLTYTTFWLEWRCWGNDPAGYHLVNLALHLASAFLLWKLSREFHLPGAWLGALLFAVHPLNVASVAWIAERKNALSMVFYLACLCSFVRSEGFRTERGGAGWYGVALACFVLAALSKSSVVMLPFVLLLLCWWQRGSIRWMDLARSSPFFAVSLGCGVVTMWFQYHRAMTPEFYDADALPLLARVLMSGRCDWFYFGKALLPIRLSMLYPRWHAGASSWEDGMPLLAWLALFAAAFLGRTRWGRGPLVALAYFTITLVPVSGLFHTSFFAYSYVSDHFVHLSLVSIIVAVSTAIGAWQQSGDRWSRCAAPAATVVAGVLCAACWQRADQFSSQKKLWESTRQVVPQNFAVYNNLGVDAMQHGRLPEAAADFRTAMRLEPRSFSAINSLAGVLRSQGNWAEAAACYQIILKIEPKAECYNDLGVMFLEMSDARQARGQFLRALALAPDMGSAYFNLYKIERAEHRYPAAAAALRECLRCDPNDTKAKSAWASLDLEETKGGADTDGTNPGLPQ